MKKLFLMLALVSTGAWGADSIPTQAKICVLDFNGTTAVYACDGGAQATLTPVGKGDGVPVMSGQILKFLDTGMRLVGCQVSSDQFIVCELAR